MSSPRSRRLRQAFGRCTIAFALTVLTGQIVDRSTGQPLTGVTVSVSGAPKSAPGHTNANGRYAVSGLAPGTYTLTVESDDVPPQHFPLTVKSPKTQTLNITACSTTLDYTCAGAQ